MPTGGLATPRDAPPLARTTAVFEHRHIMASSTQCPALTPAVLPAEALSAVADFRPAPTPGLRQASTHKLMYVPLLKSINDKASLHSIILANQFPKDMSRCNRTLLFYDDGPGGGLGYTAHIMAFMLLVAVHENRVLLNPPHHATRRWCSIPPYTLACYYEPWSHCPVPEHKPPPYDSNGEPPWLGTGLHRDVVKPWWSPGNGPKLMRTPHGTKRQRTCP